MPWTRQVPTDEWGPQEAAAIIDRINQSAGSTEPHEQPLRDWDTIRHALKFKPLEGDEAHGVPVTALTDCTVAARLSERGKLFAELKQKQATARSHAREMNLRVAFLKAEANSEGDRFNLASEQCFWRFTYSVPFLNKPRIFLVDSGDLRAVWKGEHGEHIGLQFLGGGQVQYVIFAKRPDAKERSRVYGRDTLKGVLRQIAAFGISDLIVA